MNALVLVISLPLALVMILVGFAKLQRLPASLALAARVGVPETAWRSWGALDLVATAALVVGAFASTPLVVVSAGTIGVSLTLLLVLQLRGGEPFALLFPVVLLILVAVLDVAVAAAAH